MSREKIVIIGAGLSGLVAAKKISENGYNPLVLESDSSVGGRVQTDIVDGFCLDRGFQVYLPNYSNSKTVLDYQKLDLKPFSKGMILHHHGEFYDLFSPIDSPIKSLKSLSLPFGGKKDLFLFLKLVAGSLFKSNNFKKGSKIPTYQFLKNFGFSEEFINYVIKPFASGVFLDCSLAEDSEFFLFLLKNFACGGAVLPSFGMGSITKHLAQGVNIRLETKVKNIGKHTLELSSGESIDFEHLIIATDNISAFKLLNLEDRLSRATENQKVTSCFYYKFKGSDLDWIGNALLVNSCLESSINNFLLPSLVNSTYAPSDERLICVNAMPGLSAKKVDIENELNKWFGDLTNKFEFLKTYEIKNPLPSHWGEHFHSPYVVCGDYLESPSIEGAITSGIKAARMISEKL